MTPEEIVDGFLDDHAWQVIGAGKRAGQDPRDARAELISLIAAVLAAGEQRGEEQEHEDHETWLHQQYDRLGIPRSRHGLSNATDGSLARVETLAQERDDLRAQLQASEQERAAIQECAIKRAQWQAEAEAKLEASDRLVRAARAVVKNYPWHPGNSDQRREFYYAVEELQVSLSDYDKASPGSPQEKGK